MRLIDADELVKYLKQYHSMSQGVISDVEHFPTAHMAIEALENKTTTEWIPCSERLPENIKTVLVTLREMEQPTIGWYGNIDGWRLSEKEFSCIEYEVIAWMPLPEPYKAGEQDD